MSILLKIPTVQKTALLDKALKSVSSCIEPPKLVTMTEGSTLPSITASTPSSPQSRRSHQDLSAKEKLFASFPPKNTLQRWRK